MSRADRERWDKKYAAGNPNPAFAPDPLLVQHAHLLPRHGLALDVACGVGQNAVFLAERGLEVVAIDVSLAALRYCREAIAGRPLPLHLVVADVDRLALPRNAFALIIVFRFFDRALMPLLKQALAPDGIVIYQTFNVNRLRTAPQMNRHYLLRPEELGQLFEDFETIETNDRKDISEELTFWIGRRRARLPARGRNAGTTRERD